MKNSPRKYIQQLTHDKLLYFLNFYRVYKMTHNINLTFNNNMYTSLACLLKYSTYICDIVNNSF